MNSPKTDEDVLVPCLYCGSPHVYLHEDEARIQTPDYYVSADIEVRCRNCFRRFGLSSLSFANRDLRRSMTIDAWNEVPRDTEITCPCLRCVHWNRKELSCCHTRHAARSTCMFLNFICLEEYE